MALGSRQYSSLLMDIRGGSSQTPSSSSVDRQRGEFVDSTMKKWYRDHGIEHVRVGPKSSQLNLRKRTHLSLVGMMKAMMVDAGFPTSLWPEALRNAVYLKNRVYNKGHGGRRKNGDNAKIGFVLGHTEDVVGCKVYFPEERTTKFVADLRVAEDVVYRDRHEPVDDADMESLHFEHVPAADRDIDVTMGNTIDDTITVEQGCTMMASAVEASHFQPYELEGGEDVSEHGERSDIPEATASVDATVVGSREVNQTQTSAAHLEDIEGASSQIPTEVDSDHARQTCRSPSQKAGHETGASDQTLVDSELNRWDGNESATGVCGSVDGSVPLKADENPKETIEHEESVVNDDQVTVASMCGSMTIGDQDECVNDAHSESETNGAADEEQVKKMGKRAYRDETESEELRVGQDARRQKPKRTRTGLREYHERRHPRHLDDFEPAQAQTTSEQPPVRPTSATLDDNAYLASFQDGLGLHLVMETKIKRAFENDWFNGLFVLFVTSALRRSILGWTSEKLEAHGHHPLTDSELNVYSGLEIAMNICPLNAIADYWSTDRFLGQTAFMETMTRDRFQRIRGELQFHPPDAVTFAMVRDPLYRCRGLLQHFQKRFAETAVPVVSDSFYTCHTYARAVEVFPDGEVRLLGSVRMNLVNRFNQFALEPAVQRDATQERGSWELVAAVDPEENYKQNPPPTIKSEKAAEALENGVHADTYGTMSTCWLPSTSPEAVFLCHGTVPIMRWTGDTVMHRNALVAPALVAAYNQCVNAVDRVNQLRSTNPTRRREKRLHILVFTWLLDLSIINAYALYRHLSDSTSTSATLREFKRNIADAFTRNEKAAKYQRDRRQRKRQTDGLDDAVDSDESLHVITPNSTQHSNGRLTCYLCSLRGMPSKRSGYGCSKSERGFYVGCFGAFHYKDALKADTPQLEDA
ncbi:unnamed protein product [Phytophthora fragariaefolia]|uniref:Unnamed protein product n=1 Tax=Phytophthora fragariaefolia TaxID=1490495 RepID=A0A9W6WUR5_9STRA|nr:unnamed protein product [Phytophthora fragariaefolia]